MDMFRKSQLNEILHLLNRLDAAVVVRDPGSARAAEMYDGLRKQIIQSGKSHRTHLSHLLSLQDSMERGADIELIRDRVNDYLSELGIRKTSDVSNLEAFEVVEGEGSGFECIEPAIVEILEDGSIRTHQLGKARRIAGPDEAESDFELNLGNIRNEQDKPEYLRGGQSFIGKILVFVTLLVIGVFLGRTLFDGSDAPEKINDSVDTTIEPTTTTTTTVTTTTVVSPTTTTGP